jgi:hypothetical protein
MRFHRPSPAHCLLDLEFGIHAFDQCRHRKIAEREVRYVVQNGVRCPHPSGAIIRHFRYVDLPPGRTNDPYLLSLVGLQVVLLCNETYVKTAYFCNRSCRSHVNGQCNCWGAFRGNRPLQAARS